MRSRSLLLSLILLCVIAVIVYGSLYPFHFDFKGNHPGVSDAFNQLTWARAGYADQLRNVLLYMPLGFCLCLWLQGATRSFWVVLATTILGAVLSLSMELAQVYIETRVASYMDVTLNTVGTVLGALGGLTWRSLVGLVNLPSSTRNQSGDRSALVLLVTWISWRLVEFTPHMNLTRLKLALYPILDIDISVLLTLRYLVLWLTVSQAILSYASRPRGNEALLGVIAIVLIGRIFFITPAFVSSELLALVLLLPTLVILHKLQVFPQSVVILIAAFAFFVHDRVWPLQFGRFHADFDLLPFIPWIKQGMPFVGEELLHKLFIVGGFIWLLKDSGLMLRNAMLVVISLLLAIETMHLWQATRVASITYPVLALGMGLLMRYVSNDFSVKAVVRR